VSGTNLIATRSVEHPLAPRRSDLDRAEVLTSGYVFRPVAGDPNVSQVTSVWRLGRQAALVVLSPSDVLGQTSYLYDMAVRLKRLAEPQQPTARL